jgi:hypothetical protein
MELLRKIGKNQNFADYFQYIIGHWSCILKARVLCFGLFGGPEEGRFVKRAVLILI